MPSSLSTVSMTTLPNGLRVVSDRMEHLESLSLGVWVEAGARDETADVMGVAHMLEHMAFKGTERRSARDIAEEVDVGPVFHPLDVHHHELGAEFQRRYVRDRRVQIHLAALLLPPASGNR